MITFIKTIAEQASEVMIKHFTNLKTSEFKMKTLMDPVTIADTEIEKLVIGLIKEKYPDHAILAEESMSETRTDGPLWIIDPLDGTNNYLHSIPNHCISIAYAEKGKILSALVSAPALGETYTAERGKGAFLNDKPIAVSQFSTLEQSMLCTGYADLRKYEDGTNLKVWDVIARKCSGIRRYGSAALDLCWLASGRFDGFWERDLSPWDIAAGSLIVEEAGGIIVNINPDKSSDEKFSTFDGSIIATNRNLAGTIQDLVRNTIKEVLQNTPLNGHLNNPDSITTVLELKNDMANFVAERDWDQFHNPKNLAMSISIEAAELMEIFQWKNNDEAVELMKDDQKYHHAKEELSDILAYTFSMANVLKIDIGKAFREKMRKNAKKYPISEVYGKWAD
jgi:myo-inositol-1(or 4)-monophosphatase